MTQTPGWQQAPDGSWHPAPTPGPGQGQPLGPGVPGYQPPMGYPQGPPMYGSPTGPPQWGGPPQKTSAWAVMSLVFSIIWIVGVGSILAIIFGIAAKMSIRRSEGTKKGGGLSTAGILIGIIGIIGAVGAVILSVRVYDAVTTGRLERLNVPVRITTLGEIQGVRQVTVFSWEPGTTGTTTTLPAGDQVIVVKMAVCAATTDPTAYRPSTLDARNGESLPDLGPTALVNRADHSFYLVSADGTLYGAQPGVALSPNLYGSNLPFTNGCVEGSLGFFFPAGQSPAALRYQPTVVTHYHWNLPPG